MRRSTCRRARTTTGAGRAAHRHRSPPPRSRRGTSTRRTTDVTGRVRYEVGAADALAHWLAQHPHVVMLAGTSHLDTYLDTATGALLAKGQVLRIRRRDGASDAQLRDLHADTTIME